MEFFEIADLGSNVVVAFMLIWIVTQYLPKRDKDFTHSLTLHTKAMNRLTTVLLTYLEISTNEKLQLHDEITSQMHDDTNGH